jgi:hypothetical protein
MSVLLSDERPNTQMRSTMIQIGDEFIPAVFCIPRRLDMTDLSTPEQMIDIRGICSEMGWGTAEICQRVFNGRPSRPEELSKRAAEMLIKKLRADRVASYRQRAELKSRPAQRVG